MRETTNISVDARLDAFDGIPGRPARPELVAPASVPRRAMSTVEGRAALLHALAHIEFNAINLALDILWRFRSEEHTSELQSLMRISYAVFCLKKKTHIY